jgi:Na+/proline symporter
MVLCVVLSGIFLFREIDLPISDIAKEASDKGLSRTFFFGDVRTNFHFVKMFLAGVIMIVVMTGLDQDMMQRALSSPSQRTAQRNMVLSSIFQVLLIALLLVMGAIFYLYIAASGSTNISGDDAFAFIVAQEGMPMIMSALLVLGVVAATFSATGGSITALTTSFAVDILHSKQQSDKHHSHKIRHIVHLSVTVVVLSLIFAFERWGNDSAINLFYSLSSYTYGPLLGMFLFGILSKRSVRDNLVPLVAIAAPLICLLFDYNSKQWFGGYEFGFEIMLLNAAITIGGLYCVSRE